MNLRLFLFSTLVSVAAFPALAADIPISEPAGDSAWSLTSAVTSQYLFRGVRVGGESFQPSVDYSAGALALGAWGSIGLSDRFAGDSDPELDFYGAYTFSSVDTAWSVTPGFNLYTYPDADRAAGLYRATFEPSLAVSYILSGVRLTPTVYHDFVLRGTTLELTAELALPLTSLGTELDFAASVGTFRWNDVTADASPREKNRGDYWTIGVTMPFTVTARSRVSLGVLYSKGYDNFYQQGAAPKQPNADAGSRVAVTLGYTVEL